MARSRRPLAFTLIELLVVTAVIVVLAALLYPVFAQSRAAAKSSLALTKISGVATAVLIYADDNDGRYVPVGAPKMDYAWSPVRNPKVDAAGVPWHGWGLSVLPYATSEDLFQSPLVPDSVTFTGACSNASGMKPTNSFALNWLLGRDGSYHEADDPGYDRSPDGTVLDRPIQVGEVSRPANTILLLPTSVLPPYGSDWGCMFLTLQSSDFINRILFKGEYNEGGNLSFSDGHVRWYQARMADPNTHPTVMIYHWPSRGIWIQPTMPESTMGYQNSDGIR